MVKNLIVLMSLFVFFETSIAQWLPPQWKKGVILFEMKRHTGSFGAIGSGFIVVYDDIEFMVTNKHVAINNGLFVRFNLKSSSQTSIRCSIDSMIINSNLSWRESKTADIAVMPIAQCPEIKSLGDNLDVVSFGVSSFKDWDYVDEGNDVYVLGFPLGIGTEEHYSPVVRQGIVALKNIRGRFLIDSNIFPGNSGGPVFMKPSLFDYRTKTFGKLANSYLIGIVSSYIAHTDKAISSQTGRTRIIFEENSGLAVVYSSEQIIELIKIYIEEISNQIK